jgi:hypothetical protein
MTGVNSGIPERRAGASATGATGARGAEAAAASYPWPAKLMLFAINDLVELQRAEVTFADIPQGKIHFRVEMYGFAWEYRFTVVPKGEACSHVTLEICGEAMNKAEKASHQLALLDSMLPNDKGHDRRVSHATREGL